MGSSTVELSLDPIVLQKQTFTTQKNTPHVYFFNLSLFLLFFPTICSFLFLTARLRFVQTPTPSGQRWNIFFQTIFSFKKTSCSQKKREFLIFFQNPNFFLPFVSFSTKEKKKKQDEKYHTRTTLPRAIFSLFFVFQNMVARWRSTCSWKLPICYNSTLQLLYTTLPDAIV
jgi:hypothetical protein